MAEPFAYRHDDIELVGELHRPDPGAHGRPVLVVHEADGIGGNVRRRCAMLAGLGYVAAAADLHGDGRVLGDDEIGPAMDRFRGDPPLLRGRIAAALDALVATTGAPPERIAAIGYCFGGFAVLELARSGAPIGAVASFHGLLTTNAPAAPGAIRARIFASTGALDPLVPPDHVGAFQAEMMAARADWQLIVHGRALHSFTNSGVDALGDPRMAYDPAADRQSWAALLEFLADGTDAARA
ncbi:dienelactone hydrolase family protein [Rhizorhabdus dicambivorans]|uniref:Dienelactone hydrolase family protein n=1 Tax=Rhizorhabdus dicambivorans TaxID=1850238 RepID=A0A2A4FUG4_9SPHN|nr:dienelactone hydrolase family protein [Rhizorhabdus dicambivorans]ATE66420.1 dienelactone hydrolase family protein [Rhizorhabdus dicambivorans]PCE41088.1 dienelactone hydrolase family protein [Rhizorhabdus dicambivorans]